MKSNKAQRDEVVLEVMSKYRGLVLKLSWEYWRRLPAATKIWIDPDDLIEEVYLFVISSAAKTYNNKRAGKMTFYFISIKNLLLNFALSQQTKKRFGWNVPLEEIEYMGKPDHGIRMVEAQEALNKTYFEASEELQEEMRRWFGPGKPKVRKGPEQEEIRLEFLALAAKNNLTVEDCRKMMGNGVWTR